MNSIERKQNRYIRRKEKRDIKRNSFLAEYNNFDLLFNTDYLFDAYKKAIKNVSWKLSIQRYSMNVLINILHTYKDILTDKKITKGFAEFDIVERGRKRHIKSVHIIESVFQKWLCERILTPLLSRFLIYDNGASMKNKGLHFSMKRFKVHLSKYYRKNGNDGYCLSIDFKRYFDNIKHDILIEKLKKYIHNKKILNTVKELVYAFGNNKSLGLGSQISQIFALFYANDLDMFIKEKLKIKYYGRYMDDLYLIHNDKQYLKYCLNEIIKYCKSLDITVNLNKTEIKELKHGILFLKGIYTLTNTGKIICKACSVTKKRMLKKLYKFRRLYTQGKIKIKDIYNSYQSWRGNFRKRFNSFYIIKRLDYLYNSFFIWETTAYNNVV
jgi:RNA-directed DNA polymerase